MAFAANLSLRICFHVRRGNNFGLKRQNLRSGQNHPVKNQLQPSLANEVAGTLGVFEVASQFRAAWKHGMPEGAQRSEMAKNGISNLCGFGRKVGLTDGALQERSSWNQFSGRCLGKDRDEDKKRKGEEQGRTGHRTSLVANVKEHTPKQVSGNIARRAAGLKGKGMSGAMG